MSKERKKYNTEEAQLIFEAQKLTEDRLRKAETKLIKNGVNALVITELNEFLNLVMLTYEKMYLEGKMDFDSSFKLAESQYKERYLQLAEKMNLKSNHVEPYVFAYVLTNKLRGYAAFDIYAFIQRLNKSYSKSCH